MSSGGSDHSSNGLVGPPEFSAMELLRVMSRLARPDTQYIPYFHLCRELGVKAVDGMVKGRVLDLRWTETVTREMGEELRVRSMAATPMPAGQVRDSALATQSVEPGHSPSQPVPPGSSSGTPVDLGPPPPIDDDEVMVPVTEMDMGPMHADVFEEVMEVVGPKLVPITPIMRYAMRDVVQEYEDDQSVSEYASLSDFEEF